MEAYVLVSRLIVFALWRVVLCAMSPYSKASGSRSQTLKKKIHGGKLQNKGERGTYELAFKD